MLVHTEGRWSPFFYSLIFFSAVIVFVVVSTKEYVNKFPVCNHLVSGMTSGVGETSLSQGEREKEEVIEARVKLKEKNPA